MVVTNFNCVFKKYIARVTLTGMILLSLTGCRTSTEVQSTAVTPPQAVASPQIKAIPQSRSLTGKTSPKSVAALDSAVAAPKSTTEGTPKIVPQNLPLQIKPDPLKTVRVNLYQPDIECKKLMPEPVALDRDRAMDAAVSKVLQERNSADFTVAGYRINIDDDGVATVDLRLKPDSRRQFISLSMCEQFALFGSLRETLMNHPDWKIKAVEFTERGELIQL
jgi:hypothetical protein